MKRTVILIFLTVFLLLACLQGGALAEVKTPYHFNSPVQAQAFHTLLTELRCLVCQNQNLADSHAPLAVDLRDRVYAQFQLGHSPEEIKVYLQQRYGDFVLFKPPVQANTYLLWCAPGMGLLLGLLLLFVNIRKRAEATEEA